jgi:ferredoxin
MKNIFKKIFGRCNNFARKNDIHSREGCDDYDVFGVNALRAKSIDELGAMLADDTLFPIDDEGNNEVIDRITTVIIEKKNIPEQELEAKRIAIWEGLLRRHGDTIPIRLEDVTKKRKKVVNPIASKERSVKDTHGNDRRFELRRPFVAVAAVVVFVLIGNTITTFAYGTNILQAVISFTDEVFRKDCVGNETVTTTQIFQATKTSETPALDSEYATLQEAFDACGITSQVAPTWLPEGFELVSLKVVKLSDESNIVAQYKHDNDAIIISVKSFSNLTDDKSMIVEKDDTALETFKYNGIDFYLFSNIDSNVATWFDGENDFTIQGDITFNELKNIIISMN